MIDPRAVIDTAAEIADGVHVGPYTVIGPQVVIGSGSWVGPHVVINGPTRIGSGNRIHPFASLGGDAQDKKFGGEPARLEIGSDNVVREYVSINRGTGHGGGVTRLGDRNWIMASCHVAHDCQVGNDVTFANGASLAGHVTVDDFATLGGYMDMEFEWTDDASTFDQHRFVPFITGYISDRVTVSAEIVTTCRRLAPTPPGSSALRSTKSPELRSYAYQWKPRVALKEMSIDDLSRVATYILPSWYVGRVWNFSAVSPGSQLSAAVDAVRASPTHMR